MSHTQGQQLFAGAHEAGINDLLRRFFTARPRYLKYGTPFFVQTTTAGATSLPPIPLIELMIECYPFPTVDITPGAGGTALVPGPGELIVTARFLFTVKVGANAPLPPIPLSVAARCRFIVTSSQPGTGTIGFQVLQVEIVDITPDPLETVVEQLIFNLMQTMLGVPIPFNTLTVGAFGLILLAGPAANANQIEVRGNAL